MLPRLLALGLLPLFAMCAASDPGAARVASARNSVQADPKSPQGYVELASALCRRGRDSEAPDDYREAGAALDRALELAPGNFEALKLRVQILLGLHDFAQALKSATELNHKVRDDIAVWGYLVDANMALGDYAEAEKDVQWILDLRRGSTLGYIKAAALREIWGDLEGAIEFYDEALLRTSSSDVEERSWLMSQSARLQLASGNSQRSEALLAKALALNPASQFAKRQLACLDASRGDFPGAVALYRQLTEKTANAGDLYHLAEMLDRQGQAADAQAMFQRFEAMARAEMNSSLNANRDLVFYLSDRRSLPSEALAIAQKDAGARHDSATLDALAWALFHSGRLTEAKAEMDRALSPGIRDGAYFCHALRIASALGEPDNVKRYQKDLAGMPATVCSQ